LEPKPEKPENYRVPDERRAGRPHRLGWFEKLNEVKGEALQLGKVPPGIIIMEDE